MENSTKNLPKSKILITGGLGFIGSHTAAQLGSLGHEIVILDNCSRAPLSNLAKIQEILKQKIEFHLADLRDFDSLKKIFAQTRPDGVIHFAALKSVGESCSDPGTYFDNNVTGTINLARAMLATDTQNLVFSSSCTVYGEATPPVSESAPTGATANPYGRSKFLCEKILKDFADFSGLRTVALRYFNPIGAHPSGLLGESPTGQPTNIFPFILKVAAGILPELTVFGDDRPTPDGSGVRDFIEIMDLADTHRAAISRLLHTEIPQNFNFFNVGTGQWTSVLELIRLTESVIGRPLPHRIVARRPGDIAATRADPSKIQEILGRHAQNSIHNAIQHGRNFTQKNLDLLKK